MSQSKQRMLRRAYKNYLKDYHLSSEEFPFEQFKEMFLQYLFNNGFFQYEGVDKK